MPAERVKAGKPALSRKRLQFGLQVGSSVKVTDNSGAKEALIIGVPGYKGRLRRVPRASIGDLVVVSIKRGRPELKRQVMKAIVVRQKRPYRRPDGTWVSFEDNAVVIITPEGTPKGSEIHGPIAREAAERWPSIANIATIVV